MAHAGSFFSVSIFMSGACVQSGYGAPRGAPPPRSPGLRITHRAIPLLGLATVDFSESCPAVAEWRFLKHPSPYFVASFVVSFVEHNTLPEQTFDKAHDKTRDKGFLRWMPLSKCHSSVRDLLLSGQRFATDFLAQRGRLRRVSDPALRRRPCLSLDLPPEWWSGNFHPQVVRHAGRTRRHSG